MALAQVRQPSPEEDPFRRAEVDILDDLYNGPDAIEPGPGDVRIKRIGNGTGHLILRREHIRAHRY